MPIVRRLFRLVSRGSFFPLLLSSCLAAAGALAMALSAPGSLHTHVLGLGGDPYQTLWRFTGLQEALARGTLAVPGEPLRNLGPLPWLLVHTLTGEPLAYNIVWMLQFPLAVGATFALGRVLGLHPLAAAFAGLLVAFAPYRIAQSLGHFGAMQLFWIPAMTAAFLNWLRRPSYVRVFLLALVGVATAWTEHTLFLTALLALCVLLVVVRRELRAVLRRGEVWRHIAVLVLILFLGGIAPFRQEVLRTASSTSELNPGHEQRLRFTPTFAALVTPPTFHAMRRVDAPYGTSSLPAADRVVSLGTALLVLAGVAVIRERPFVRQRELLLPALLTLTGIALSLAPRTTIGAALFNVLPFFSAVRAVDRFLALAVMTLPLLAVRVLTELGTNRSRGYRALAVVLASLLLFEGAPQVPFPSQRAVIAPAYAALAQDSSDGGVLEAGASVDYVLASHAVFASTTHHRPVLGSIAFERVEKPPTRTQLLRLPVVRDLLLLRVEDLEQPTFFRQHPARIAASALRSGGVAHVVLHASVDGHDLLRQSAAGVRPITREELQRVQTFLRAAGLSEVAQAEGTVIYRVPAAAESIPVAARGSGWQRVSRRQDGTVQAALTHGATVEVYAVEPVRNIQLSFRIARGSRSGRLRLRDNPRGETSAVPGDVVRLDLGAVPSGMRRYVMDIDAPEIIVENPSVTFVSR